MDGEINCDGQSHCDGESMEVGGRQIIYLSLYNDHQNDFRIKMGNDESHFNVSLIVTDKVTRQCPQTTTFEEKGEPKRIRTEVPLLTSLTPYLLGQPGSRGWTWYLPSLSCPYGLCGRNATLKKKTFSTHGL